MQPTTLQTSQSRLNISRVSDNPINSFFDPSLLQTLQALRRHLHANPEVSNEEQQTAAHVRSELGLILPDAELIDLDATGFAALAKGKDEGPRVLLRCELDALPIQEVNDFDHRSKTDGVSHKCGHDGHMTMLIAVAHWLAKHPPVQGEIVLLFQSAEETGDGALAAFEAANFNKIRPDFVYALHNIPGAPRGQVLVKNGAFTPSVKSLIFRFEGRTSHAAEPEKGHNPALAMADCIRLTEAMTLNDPTSDAFFLITPVHSIMGEKAYGISAGYGEVHLTIRAWDEDLFKRRSDELIEKVTQIAEQQNLKCRWDWCFEFQANQNHETAVAIVKKAAQTAESELIEMREPFKFGEDFGLFTQHFQGAMFGLGAGADCPALHNPDYDFPDELTPVGAGIFIHILKEHLRFV